MATMKVKNAAGEWVEVDSAIKNTAGLYIDRLEAVDNQFDLTKYINCNHFILFYTATTTGSTSTNYTKYAYDSQNKDGYSYVQNTSAIKEGVYELFGYTSKYNGDDMFKRLEWAGNSWAVSGTESGGGVERETMHFSHPKKTLGTYGVIIYAM